MAAKIVALSKSAHADVDASVELFSVEEVRKMLAAIPTTRIADLNRLSPLLLRRALATNVKIGRISLDTFDKALLST